MFKRIKLLLSLLTREQKKKLFYLQIFVVLTAFAELASILSIGPFMALVGSIDTLSGTGQLAQVYQITGISEPEVFLFYLGLAVIIILACSSLISIYTTWRLSLYGAKLGAELSIRLYCYYMYQPWLFHATRNSSILTNRIAQEVGRVTNQIIQPLMMMNSKLIMTLVLIVSIFIFNPLVAFVGLFLFISVYYLLYRVVRGRLSRNGQKITQANKDRFRLMNEGFGGIKDTLLLGRQEDFNSRYRYLSVSFGEAQGLNRALSQAPRYVMELIAFGSVIFLILYLIKEYKGNLGEILPILSVYALAGFKLLPAFQQLYVSLTQIKSSLSAFDSLKPDLIASQENIFNPHDQHQRCSKKTKLHKSIKLSNVFFKYPGKEQFALQGVDIEIHANNSIGFVGSSGSGKSTAVDILLGLIPPTSGELLIDGEKLNSDQLREWQNNLGFVPQSIFLSDASIKENIAFGLPHDQIDNLKIKKAITMANLEELIGSLPDGINTQVGERGVQLSGGQRQRIGIARALYNDADILVLDEATSALDGITERFVMDAVKELSGKKTIIMIAHRLSTVRNCDCIYLLDNGKVMGCGTFDELVKNNPLFKKMASASV